MEGWKIGRLEECPSSLFTFHVSRFMFHAIRNPQFPHNPQSEIPPQSDPPHIRCPSMAHQTSLPLCTVVFSFPYLSLQIPRYVKVLLQIRVFKANRPDLVEWWVVSVVKNLLTASLLCRVVRPSIDLEVQIRRLRMTAMLKLPPMQVICAPCPYHLAGLGVS